jgi:hypothetical protein
MKLGKPLHSVPIFFEGNKNLYFDTKNKFRSTFTLFVNTVIYIKFDIHAKAKGVKFKNLVLTGSRNIN